jgi:hypothetical protein
MERFHIALKEPEISAQRFGDPDARDHEKG